VLLVGTVVAFGLSVLGVAIPDVWRLRALEVRG
jgi:hypothetical protein